MSSSNLPEPVFTAFQPVAAALAELAHIELDPMRETVAAVARIAQQQVTDLNATLAAVQPVTVALASVQADLHEAVTAMTRTTAQHMQEALSQIDLSFDTTGLARALRDVQAWRDLNGEQWATASRVLDDAYRTAEAGGATDDVPDDLVTGLADTARTFAASQEGFGFLTPERQRQLFVYFWGLLVLAALMQASFTSETADTVIEKTIALSPAFALTVVAAGKGWDKYMRRPEGEETEATEEVAEDSD
ncbi:hypothetical protein GCM10027073_29310 [Streptomyces chlorus]|uniref:Uncharacterized protein n=1 Tax=Streptomyces chlorus TaxID=887452 RepID=A0ABW1DX93_9ACTN